MDMKYNEYYNSVMNFRSLALDLKKQGFRCEISEDGNYLLVYYLCFSDYAEICLSASHGRSIKNSPADAGLSYFLLHGNRTSMNLYLCDIL